MEKQLEASTTGRTKRNILQLLLSQTESRLPNQKHIQITYNNNNAVVTTKQPKRYNISGR